MPEGLLKKSAHAAVVNDNVLSGEVAAQVCSSLGLSSTNATLGRKVVSLALAAQDAEEAGGFSGGLDAFEEQAGQYGSIAVDLLRDIYHKVAARRTRALAELRRTANGGAAASAKIGAGDETYMAPQLKGGLLRRPGGAAAADSDAPTFAKPKVFAPSVISATPPYPARCTSPLKRKRVSCTSCTRMRNCVPVPRTGP